MASLVQKKIFYGITVGNTNKDLELNKSIVIDSFHSSIENLNIPRSFFCTEDCNRFSRSNTNEFGFFKKKKVLSTFIEFSKIHFPFAFGRTSKPPKFRDFLSLDSPVSFVKGKNDKYANEDSLIT